MNERSQKNDQQQADEPSPNPQEAGRLEVEALMAMMGLAKRTRHPAPAPETPDQHDD